LAQLSSGLIEGSGPFGTRRSPPQRNSLIVGIAALGSRKPERIGCTFLNPSPAQREDARIRSNRAPRDLLPSDFMMRSSPLEELYEHSLPDEERRVLHRDHDFHNAFVTRFIGRIRLQLAGAEGRRDV
jgi:hypothetical protein